MAKNGRFFEALTVAVAGGESVKAAAKACGCSPRQAYRLAAGGAFRSRVAELRTAAVEAAVGALSESARGAVAVLSSIMADAEQKSGDRIAAAKSLLGLLGPVAELAELRARLDRIEARQDEQGGQK